MGSGCSQIFASYSTKMSNRKTVQSFQKFSEKIQEIIENLKLKFFLKSSEEGGIIEIGYHIMWMGIKN